MTEACRTCKFYLPLDPLNGDCRRYPRMREMGSGLSKIGYYPRIAGIDWCGEWQPSKELQVLFDKYSKEKS